MMRTESTRRTNCHPLTYVYHRIQFAMPTLAFCRQWRGGTEAEYLPPHTHFLYSSYLTSSRRLRRHFARNEVWGREQSRNPRLNFESLAKSRVLNVHTKKKSEHYLTPSSVLQTISVFPLSTSAMFQIIETAVNLGGLKPPKI